MLSPKELVQIDKRRVEDEVRRGYTDLEIYSVSIVSYYVLSDGTQYSDGHSPNDIYAFYRSGGVWPYDGNTNLGLVIYGTHYPSLSDIVQLFLQKKGFIIEDSCEDCGYLTISSPTPNLKYYILSATRLPLPYYRRDIGHMIITVYDIDVIANNLGLSQLIEQKLGKKPGKVSRSYVDKMITYVAFGLELAGHSFDDALRILEYYYWRSGDDPDDAPKIASEWRRLFPISYRECYIWDRIGFVEVDCSVLENYWEKVERKKEREVTPKTSGNSSRTGRRSC